MNVAGCPTVTVVAMAGNLDADMFPHFLSHYRALGVSAFRFVLHGEFEPAEKAWLCDQPDVTVTAEIYGLFSEQSKVEKISWMTHDLVGQWVLPVDMDELIELPAPSLAETIRAMEMLEMESLPAFMLQRLAADGSLPMLLPTDDIQKIFPLYSFHLAERSGGARPLKTKYTLTKVAKGHLVQHGFHFPMNGGGTCHLPLRAILNHFKFRAPLLKAARAYRAEDANPTEMAAYSAYLESHESRVELEGNKEYNRDDLLRRGLLIDFDSNEPVSFANSALLGDATSQVFAQPVQVLDPCSATSIDKPSAGRARPMDVCLVTREISVASVAGGIATAVNALAENLAAAGHNAHVLYVPYEPWDKLGSFWERGLMALGIKLTQIELVDQDGQRLELEELMDLVVAHLEKHSFDVACFDDVHCLGAKACQVRNSGLGLASTAIVMTTHGCSYWHSSDGNAAIDKYIAKFHFYFEQQLRLADLVIHPSSYMQQWVQHHVGPPRREAVLPNTLTGFVRSFGHRGSANRKVTEIVYFGRIEPRKGFDVFLAAMALLADRGVEVPSITLIGSISSSVLKQNLSATLERLTAKVQIFSEFRNLEAVNYLKAHDCMVVIPSRKDNLPYTVYECLENDIPMICSQVGGLRELVHENDWGRTLVANDETSIADAVRVALRDGWRPARLAFDPDEVVAKHVAVMDWLVQNHAEHQRQKMDLSDILCICFGQSSTPPVSRQAEDLQGSGLKEDQIVYYCIDGNGRAASVVNAINDHVGSARAEFILLCHEAVEFKSQALLPAMVNLMTCSGFDAVVCDYDLLLPLSAGQTGTTTCTIGAPGGPPQFAPSRNVFGAGLALVRTSALLDVGGIDADSDLQETMVWEVLNKLSASGKSITSIPKALMFKYVQDNGSVDQFNDPQMRYRLSRTWCRDLDASRALMLSAAIHHDFKPDPRVSKISKLLKSLH